LNDYKTFIAKRIYSNQTDAYPFVI